MISRWEPSWMVLGPMSSSTGAAAGWPSPVEVPVMAKVRELPAPKPPAEVTVTIYESLAALPWAALSLRVVPSISNRPESPPGPTA